MKAGLGSFLFLIALFSAKQTQAAEYDSLDGQIKIRVLIRSGVYRWALARYPSWWASEPTRKAKTIVFIHGGGEGGSGESGLADLSGQSVPYFIKQGTMPASFINPKTAATEEFLFVSIQHSGSGMTCAEVWYAIKNSPNLSRVDPLNVTLMGLSAGGRTISRFFPEERADTLAGIRSIVLMSSPQAGDALTYTFNSLISQAKPLYQIWSLTDNEGGTISAWNVRIRDTFELRSPSTYAKLNYSGGHCCWNTYSSPSNKQNITFPVIGTKNVNVYEWVLAWSYDPDNSKPPDKSFPVKKGRKTVFVKEN